MKITASQKILIYRVIFYVALSLFIVSLSVHVVTLFNVNLQAHIPFVFLLHIGIFVLLAPILLLQKLEDKEEDEKIFAQNKEPKINQTIEYEKAENQSNLQGWIYAISFILVVYVLINFAIFVIGVKGQPEISNGKYILKDKSTIVKELTKEEYDIESARVLRGFSGHWLLFYFYFSSIGYLNGFRKSEKKRI